ncbi:hypothetical protein [Wolbachia pipientis]|uniref:hypothetical protein n=1 Tax=Wolbachia pipientis TaxID=955 RepID=UPI0025A3B938|nr:hypothetical protein [Wolbachia pipientis]MDM8335736.1 hypothetical protein [Wolbachia pipientis]
MPENNSKKELNEKNKPQEQEEGRSGSFVELLKNIIKALFNSGVDLSQQEQFNTMQIDQQQGLDNKGKSPEELNPKAKLKVKEAAEGLKERLQKPDADNQSVEIKAPNQTSVQDIDSSKTMER